MSSSRRSPMNESISQPQLKMIIFLDGPTDTIICGQASTFSLCFRPPNLEKPQTLLQGSWKALANLYSQKSLIQISQLITCFFVQQELNPPTNWNGYIWGKKMLRDVGAPYVSGGGLSSRLLPAAGPAATATPPGHLIPPGQGKAWEWWELWGFETLEKLWIQWWPHK